MNRLPRYVSVLALLWSVAAFPAAGQMGTASTSDSRPAALSATDPLPDPGQLLQEVERNEEHMDVLRNDYTYHVHFERERLRKDGSAKETEITDSESLTLDGVRVNRVVARNGKPLTAEEQAKESERLDKEVEKVKERRAKTLAAGEKTDPRGDTVITVARLLQLGSFSNERRVEYGGRPTIVLDYVGNPKAKTQSQAETVVRDLVGTVWIDETDRVLVRGQGHFLSNFKIGGGLLADVRKDSSFSFEAKRINGSVWLPAAIDGKGSVRILLVSGFDGLIHLTMSDYKRFRTSATILTKAPEGSIAPAAVAPASGSEPKPEPELL